MDSVLNGKIAALGLIPIDKKAYIKYLKPLEKAHKKSGIDVQYYKLYGEKPMFYSVEYLRQTSIKELLEKDKWRKDMSARSDIDV
ncbi:hydrolase [Bacillus toyonensis]|uniref:hydrolase n=1 Tax=Bacillus toyonensis TaxID=155322 RepID=UPI000BFD464F|nr:hydrolase [Bacillus toyonensis]PHA15511.1 hydrolase [Bacillus toyonensis]